MSRQKTIHGTLTFSEAAPRLEEEFGRIFKVLSKSYCAEAVRPTGVNGEAAPKPLPFAVALTFQERGADSQVQAVTSRLIDLLHRIAGAVGTLQGPIGLGARLLEAARHLFSGDDTDERDVRARADARDLVTNFPQALGWSGAQRVYEGWRASATEDDHGLAQISKSDWDAFVERLKGIVAPPEPVDAAGAAAAPAQPAPPAVGPEPTPSASPTPFQITQLLGWLSEDEETYSFEIDGVCRFPSDGVEYGPWGRFDVLGPDGSQLLTHYIPVEALKDWLGGEGGKALEVPVSAVDELRAALIRREIKEDTGVEHIQVRGRLWFSDGRPFGTRNIGVYLPPHLPKLLDGCDELEDFAEDGCCGGDEPPPILQTPQALAVTQTDADGYFEFSYEALKGPVAGHVLFQISGVAIPLALKLETPEDGAEPRFPPRVLLQVESRLDLGDPGSKRTVDWLGENKDDCGCGGLEFDRPNRAVDEFRFDVVVRTTDPMVKRARLRPSDSGGSPQPPHADLIPLPEADPRSSPVNALFRAAISRDEPVIWDDEPLLTQAVTIAHGRLLTIKQVWRADGYSLGDLKYSLPLAPLQKKNIAIVDWDRRDSLAMESTWQSQDSLYNFVGRERDISEIVNSAVNESVNGRSESGGGSSSGGFGISLGPIGFGGASGGSSSAWSTSSQTSMRSLAASFLNQLRDQTVQSANSHRAQRSTTIQQVDQSEGARAVTETVANRNACHAITVQYFEVLRHFRVDYELAAVRECLYVPLPIAPFDADKALRWRTVLAQYLPSLELREALDACERLAEPVYPGPNTPSAEEALTTIRGEFELVLDFAFPTSKIDDEATWETFFGWEPASPTPLPSLFARLRRLDPDRRPDYFDDRVAPQLAEKLVESLTFSAERDGAPAVALPLRASLVTKYRAGKRHTIVVRQTGPLAPLRRVDLTALTIKAADGLPDFCGAAVQKVAFRASTAHRDHLVLGVADETAMVGALDGARINTPPAAVELSNPQADDERARRRLMAHLNENVEYYHKAIWWRMDPDRRFSLLDGFTAPNAGGRSVASVVENRIVAIAGNALVMPVAPGLRLDYFDDGEDGDETAGADRTSDDWLLARYRPLIPNPSTSIAVPTRGVFAESIMGSCNSCERIDDTRNWRYWEHPLPDEPTEIDPTWLDSRARDAKTVEPGAAPQPSVINQVATTVPNAPEPVSLAGVLAALTSGSIFRDATGLAGTQQNARDALSQSYASTTRFGELGAELSKKQIDASLDVLRMFMSAYTGVPMGGGGGDSGSIPSSVVMKGIASDAAAGRITERQAQDLTSEAHRKLVDGLGKRESLPDIPEVRRAIEAASEQGSPVSVSHGESAVQIGPSDRRRAGSFTLWPFGGRDAPSRKARSAAAPLPTYTIEIVTAIRDVKGALEVGEKSRQILILDCAKRTLNKPAPTTGKTWVPVFGNRNAVRTRFEASLDDVHDNVFLLSAFGQTASGVYIMPDIDYRLRLAVDPVRRRIHLTGAHDGFPTYSVLVDGRTVYEFEQGLFVEAYADLAGTSDVPVDKWADL